MKAVPLVAAALALLASASAAQEPSEPREPPAPKAQLDDPSREVVRYFERMREQSRRPETSVVLDLVGAPSRGAEGAPLVLVELSDYECGFCSTHFRDTWPRIEAEYVATGKLRYVFLDLPLPHLHSHALLAAQAAHCAGDQGEFWAMHDRLLSHDHPFEPWRAHAEALGLDAGRFVECLESGAQLAAVVKGMNAASKADVDATPTSFVALPDATGDRVYTLVRIDGAKPYEWFQEKLDALLAAQQ